MASVVDVATYILELSKENVPDGEYELISPMKLQKLVYYCQGYYLALYGSPLFPDPIEAWQHGPVCPRLYHLLRVYGNSPIAAIIDPARIRLSENEKTLIGMVYGNYGQYSASRLRAMTHAEEPWKNTYNNGTISRDSLKEYFNSLLDVDPDEIPPTTPEEKREILKAIKEAEANGEIDLSQFCGKYCPVKSI
jgi:uncharacterized phage-associated protein